MASRREFLATLGGTGVLLAACRGSRATPLPGEEPARIAARPGRPLRDVVAGFSALELTDPATGRGGRLYAPRSYSRDTPAPLIVLLHGAGGASRAWESERTTARADAIGAVILAPDSRGRSWDLIVERDYGADVTFIDAALRWTFERCNIHPERIAIGGFSDGASVALSYGLANGDLFGAVMAFSPGFVDTEFKRGRPRVFVSHGRSDQILRFEHTDRIIMSQLRLRGVPVEYMPFDGGHTIPPAVGDAAFRWFASRWG